MPCWTDTGQADPGAAAEFYGELFGWQLEDVLPPGAGPYFMARIRGGDVAAITQPEEHGAPADWRTYIRVERADDTAERVRAAGGTVVAEPFDVGEAGRMAVVADPGGARFRVWEPRRHHGAGVVNEHGAVNFNTLHTSDPERAKPFYRAVFGWDTLELGPGMTMWTQPGYGDHLEAKAPGLREQMASLGAPPRFEDVVASMVPCQDGEPPHWSVTFAVDDADATAQRAAELGGEVTVAPFDAPWVRTTVITDPQGASFMASKFVPENKDLLAEPAVSRAA
ncbi:MAG TPA: VOC family protein [Solirubrobacteraceae bacterium]|nr:VOC family protein [Solirubrobacteraceae bacterium]